MNKFTTALKRLVAGDSKLSDELWRRFENKDVECKIVGSDSSVPELIFIFRKNITPSYTEMDRKYKDAITDVYQRVLESIQSRGLKISGHGSGYGETGPYSEPLGVTYHVGIIFDPADMEKAKAIKAEFSKGISK